MYAYLGGQLKEYHCYTKCPWEECLPYRQLKEIIGQWFPLDHFPVDHWCHSPMLKEPLATSGKTIEFYRTLGEETGPDCKVKGESQVKIQLGLVQKTTPPLVFGYIFVFYS